MTDEVSVLTRDVQAWCHEAFSTVTLVFLFNEFLGLISRMCGKDSSS